MKDLRKTLAHTLAALIEADEHIREKLQPEFEKLARGEDVSYTDKFGREVALERLATWWHVVGTQDTIREAQEALENADPVTEAPAVAAMRELTNQQLAMCWTAEGVRQWWDRERHQLGGQTPREAFKTDPMRVYQLAVGGRAQVAT